MASERENELTSSHVRLDDDESVGEEEDLTDYGLGYPDYDVAERLKEINAQWDKEPLPQDSRQRYIEFKPGEELASVYVPELYPEEDDNTSRTTDNNSLGRGDDSHTGNGGLSSSDNQTHIQQPSISTNHETAGRLPGKPLLSDTRQPTNLHTTSNDGYPTDSRSKTAVKFSDSGNEEDQSEPNSNNNSAMVTNSKNEDQSATHDQTNDYSSPTTSPTPGGETRIGNDKTGRDSPMSSLSDHESEDTTPKAKLSDNRQQAAYTDNDQTKPAKDEEKVLVEVNGKFELLSVAECQSMGLPLPDDLASETESNQSEPQTQSSVHSSRPRSSVGPRTQAAHSNSRTRAQSAGSSRQSASAISHWPDWSSSGYQSPYGLTPQQKELKSQREKVMKEREQAYRQRKKEEEQQKKEEAESAFQWWLMKKQEEQRSRKSDESKTEDPQAKAKENEEAFNAWCASKKEQQKKERLLKHREQKERDDGYFLRSREECDRAFRSWLKNKRKQDNLLRAAWAAKHAKRKRHRSRTALAIRLE